MLDKSAVKVRVMAIRYEAPDVRSYVLRRIDGVAFPPIDPGSHIDVQLSGAIERSFSLSNSNSDQGDYRITVAREENGLGGSKLIHDSVRAGDVLTISEPRNNFALVQDAARSLFIAGGIGITPFIPMLTALNRARQIWKLVYCARDPERTPLLGEANGLAETGNGEVVLHFSGNGGGRLDIGNVVADLTADTHVYCCGPVGMLRDFRAVADQNGIPGSRLHFEYFKSDAERAKDGGFTVVLQRSGKQVLVQAGQTILEALQDVGIEVSYSCMEGICGSCETRVISGTPDHRDMVLSERDRRTKSTMMVCCSGAKSDRLVLDL